MMNVEGKMQQEYTWKGLGVQPCPNVVRTVANGLVANVEIMTREALKRKQVNDDLRVSNKRAVREKLREIALREARRAEIENAIRSVDAELDCAVEQHMRDTAPTQSALKKIEAEIVAALTAGKTVDALEQRRAELHERLRGHNEKLQAVSEKLNQRRKLLESELDSPELETSARAALESMFEKLSSVALRAEKFAADQSVVWAERRIKAADDELWKCGAAPLATYDDTPSGIAPSDRERATLRRARWKAERAAAGREYTRARQSLDDVLERMRKED